MENKASYFGTKVCLCTRCSKSYILNAHWHETLCIDCSKELLALLKTTEEEFRNGTKSQAG